MHYVLRWVGRVEGWGRFIVALLIIMIGRLTLKFEGRGSFSPGTSL